MSTAQAGVPQAASAPRQENLALAFQEVLTAIVRLRSNRQVVHDAEQFRGQVRQALQMANQEGRRLGYPEEDIKLTVFATVAFLDESVLNLQSPVFADWARKPMQEELFGRHTAGEIFFDQLQQLLARREATQLADLLEIYQICMLLGFVGKYSVMGRGELKAVMDAVEDKILRARAPRGDISPSWRPVEQVFTQTASDPWVKKMMWIAVGCAAVALVLFVSYKMMLGSGLSSLETLAGPMGRQ